jgi:AcrR family transcriptional regulator
VSPPILYRHFSGKRELFAALLEHAAEQVLDSWRAAAGGLDDPARRLEAIGAAASASQPAMNVLLRALADREGDAAADTALRRQVTRLHRFLCTELKTAPGHAWRLMESWTGTALLGPLRAPAASR